MSDSASRGGHSMSTEGVRPVPPSQGAAMLRQPGASAAAAPYNSSQAYGSTQSRFVPDPVLGLPSASFHNTSGTIGEVPSEIAKGFNLGAAVITFWWLRSHNLKPMAWWLLVFYFVGRCLGRYVHFWPVPVGVALLDLGLFIGLGFVGKRIAWQNRRFDDIGDFKACQRIWMLWAMPIVVFQGIGMAVLLLLIATKIF